MIFNTKAIAISYYWSSISISIGHLESRHS